MFFYLQLAVFEYKQVIGWVVTSFLKLLRTKTVVCSINLDLNKHAPVQYNQEPSVLIGEW